MEKRNVVPTHSVDRGGLAWRAARGAGCIALIGLLSVLAACAGDQRQQGTDATKTEAPLDPQAQFLAEQGAWRQERLDRLTAPFGWLSLIDLMWLDNGSAVLGSGPDCVLRCVALPAAQVGTVTLQDGAVTFETASGATVTSGGLPVGRMVLVPDTAEEATVLAVGTCTIQVIERGGRFGLRIRDRTSPVRTQFAGFETYPADSAWRVPARFEAYDAGRTVSVHSVIGLVEPTETPGCVHFDVQGVPCTLTLVGAAGDASWFCVFADATSGGDTYGGGRFLEIDAPGPDGMTVVDFNRAFNPPCAFTRFATCPLPPEGNRLPVAITAGERSYDAGH